MFVLNRFNDSRACRNILGLAKWCDDSGLETIPQEIARNKKGFFADFFFNE
ncbi:hypothetical protein [Bartonella elizabethae]|uniref:hypothetical protein n=1 Tax=Bartonella elizabethae TaxID=807 RepID=UPI0002FDB106|nr:hypothetical protein [Bartonella elizabethae]